MKLKPIARLFSLVLLMLMPSLVALQPPQGGAQWRTLAQELATLGQTIEGKLSGLTAADLREFKQFMIDTGYDQSSPTAYRIVKDKTAQ